MVTNTDITFDFYYLKQYNKDVPEPQDNLLSFLTPQIRDNLITILAGAERRNGD